MAANSQKDISGLRSECIRQVDIAVDRAAFIVDGRTFNEVTPGRQNIAVYDSLVRQLQRTVDSDRGRRRGDHTFVDDRGLIGIAQNPDRHAGCRMDQSRLIIPDQGSSRPGARPDSIARPQIFDQTMIIDPTKSVENPGVGYRRKRAIICDRAVVEYI